MVRDMGLRKVLVVGAGLGGLLTSYVMVKRGFDVELLEEHDVIGLPRHCSGLVSDYVVGFLGGFVKEHITNRFSEYVVKVVEDVGIREVLTLTFRKPVYLIDRVGIEKSLCEVVTSLGGRVSTRTVVTNIDLSRNLLRSSKGTHDYDLVVISEGAGRRLIKSLNLCRVREYALGPQALLKTSRSPENVEVVVGSFLGPDGFGWVIPIDEKHVILGLVTTSKRAALLLKYLAKKVFSTTSNYVFKEFFGGLIPMDKPCENVVGENYLIVGDAASLIKPVSRGGIYSLVEEVGALRDSLYKGSINQDLMLSRYRRLVAFLKTQHSVHEVILGVGGYYKLVKSFTKLGLSEVRLLDYDKLIPCSPHPLLSVVESTTRWVC
jgi:flavin-dependent dehydrogenase